MRRPPSLRRDISHITRRWARRRLVDENVLAARRLMVADPTPETVDQWVQDVRHLIGVVLAPSPSTLPFVYVSNQQVDAELAAKRVKNLLDTVSAEELINQVEQDRASLMASCWR